MSGTSSEENPIIPLSEAHRFIKECMIAVGTPEIHAQAVATNLTEADYMGHFCHGMNRLEVYLNEIREGICNTSAEPEILRETVSTAWVDGHNGLGVVIGTFCMDLAIKKAKEVGVGWIVAKHSNRFGIAGNYSLSALKQGIIGMCFSNAAPMVAPTRAKTAALGTNPISLAAPALEGDHFFLDMATSAVAAGKIEVLSRKNLPVPEDWANFKTGALRPLGGKEPNSNYKGFGLAMLVEIFCGILGGSAFGPHIRKYGDFHKVANLGQCFVAIDPSFFAPEFENRMSDLMNYIRNMEPESPDKPVMIPGDLEQQHMNLVDKEGGVRYVPDQINTCEKFAEDLKVKPLQPLTTNI